MHIKKMIHHNQIFSILEMQGCFEICTSIYLIKHKNVPTDKNHLIVSIDTDKAFAKIQCIFLITVTERGGQEGTSLNRIKVI